MNALTYIKATDSLIVIMKRTKSLNLEGLRKCRSQYVLVKDTGIAIKVLDHWGGGRDKRGMRVSEEVWRACEFYL